MKRFISLVMAVFFLLSTAAGALASAEPESVQASEEPEAVPAEDVAVEEPEAYADMDPDDPLYELRAERLVAADGTSGQTFSDFTARALKSGETLHRGIDVSVWQGSIDWKKVIADGIEFVFIRGAYRAGGTGKIATDKKFESYIKDAKDAGLLVGVYIFSQAITPAEGREEANYLLDLVERYEIDLPLVIDYEYIGTSGRLYNAGLSRQAGTDVCNAFCETVEAAGYDSMVYANPSMLSSKLYPEQLGRLWLAHYTESTSYAARDYEYWQCSGTGAVSGIKGEVDLDFWFEQPVFSDVVPGNWFYENVMNAYESGIVKGISKTKFDPNTTATRGAVITMLHRQQGSPSVTGETEFTDLAADYYKMPIAWAVEKGVTTGVTETTFAPGDGITRQDLVTMLWRLSGKPETAGNIDSYADSEDVSAYAVTAMAWAVEKEILTGYPDNTLAPRSFATRAQVCAILMRFASVS